MKPSTPNQRRTLLIDPQFQIRVALWASVWMMLEVLIAAGALMVAALTSVWIPAGHHVVFFYRLSGILTGVVLLLTLVNIGGAIYFAHRISGPLYRIRQSMRKVAEGDLSVLIHLREHDELQELKDDFNEMVNSLRERVLAVEPGLKSAEAPAGRRAKPTAGAAGAQTVKTAPKAKKAAAVKSLRQVFKV